MARPHTVYVEGTSKHAVEFKDGEPVQKDRYNTAQHFNLNVEFADGDVVMNIRHDVDNGIGSVHQYMALNSKIE